MVLNIQVHEHEGLLVGSVGSNGPTSKEKSISQSDLKKLKIINKKNDNKFFKQTSSGIKFSQYVGMMQVGTTQITVLPKISLSGDTKTDGDETSLKTSMNVFMDMLQLSNYFDVEHPDQVDISYRYQSLPEYLIAMFIKECSALFHYGLKKRYVQYSDDLIKVRGRILFERLYSRTEAARHSIPCSYQEYSVDHLLNQVVARTVSVLRQIETRGRYSATLHSYAMLCEGITQRDITHKHFEMLKRLPTIRHYDRLIKLCEMILQNYTVSTSYGNNTLFSLMVNMDVLFEKYVSALIKRYGKKDYIPKSQKQKMYIKFNQNEKFVRPDMLLTARNVDNSTQPVSANSMILDTKWKKPDDGLPSSGDLYQMYMYKRVFGVSRSVLLYPSSNGKERQFDGTYRDSTYRDIPDMVENNNICSVRFLKLSINNKRLDSKQTYKVLEAKLKPVKPVSAT